MVTDRPAGRYKRDAGLVEENVLKRPDVQEAPRAVAADDEGNTFGCELSLKGYSQSPAAAHGNAEVATIYLVVHRPFAIGALGAVGGTGSQCRPRLHDAAHHIRRGDFIDHGCLPSWIDWLFIIL
jgi:hypothetical protein